MDARYAEWIERYADECGGHDRLRGMCGSATARMAREFPELRRVPGTIYFAAGNSEHWWCETEAGEVVDPTASQFAGILSYSPWRPGDEVCVGKCMNCGEHIYDNPATLEGNRRSICSPECGEELTKACG